MARARKWLAPALFAALLSLQGCGGGGGNGSSSSSATTSTNAIATAAPNVQPISVDSGLSNSVNQLFTNITLCAPGSSTGCVTIDHVLVDTGSTGLRVVHSAPVASLSLPPQTDASRNPIVECAHFADGNTWGPVKLADLKIAGEQAGRLPIQVIGDPGFAAVPGACSRSGPAKNPVQDFGANGILGVAIFRQDCGDACAQPNNLGIYFTCASSVCKQTAIPLALQLQHPVSLFAGDNNGVIIELPPVPAAGLRRVSGSLVFGIGTRANNGLGTATVIGVDPGTANFTTVYNSNTYSASFIDSGSNGLFLQDSITVCAPTSAAAEFYCPASTINGSATIRGVNGAGAPVNFSVANAVTLLTSNPGFAAFANLAAPQFSADSFDWGLPFFYGRNVYTAIEGLDGSGAYVAF